MSTFVKAGPASPIERRPVIAFTLHELGQGGTDRVCAYLARGFAEAGFAVELIVLGGVVRRNYRSLVGFLTEQAIRQVHADVLFLGTSGVRRDGSVLDTTAVEVPVKRAMLEAAERAVLVADASKFPGRGIARVCGPTDLAAVVTEPGSDPETLAGLAESGVEIITSLEGPP